MKPKKTPRAISPIKWHKFEEHQKSTLLLATPQVASTPTRVRLPNDTCLIIPYCPLILHVFSYTCSGTPTLLNNILRASRHAAHPRTYKWTDPNCRTSFNTHTHAYTPRPRSPPPRPLPRPRLRLGAQLNGELRAQGYSVTYSFSSTCIFFPLK